MKNFVKALSIILCAVLAAFSLAACSDPGAPENVSGSPTFAVSEAAVASELEAFMALGDDRTSFTEAEHRAALYLNNRLLEMGYEDVSVQEFAASEDNMTNLASQNVIAHLLPQGSRTSATKSVIIGAYYDNRYNAAYKGDTSSNRSAGALANGTGVATLLSVAEYFINSRNRLASDLDVTVVFFGASYVSVQGARAFLDRLSAREYQNTLLMIELQRLGGDHVYAFSDARKTEREGFFDGVASANGLDIYKPTQKSPLISGASVLKGVPYYQWAHSGVFPVFFNENVPTLNLVGANWETGVMSDRESSESANIALKENDTLENLKNVYPDYAAKMATAATLVVKSVCDGEFMTVMQHDRDNFPDTSALSMTWIWYLIVLCVVIIAAAVMLALVSYLKKKHPIVVMQPPQVKMAVFGMDYEDARSGDIFVDIHPSAIDEEIFPGVKNNTKDGGPTLEIKRDAPPSDGQSKEESGDKHDDNDDPFGF